MTHDGVGMHIGMSPISSVPNNTNTDPREEYTTTQRCEVNMFIVHTTVAQLAHKHTCIHKFISNAIPYVCLRSSL